MTRRRARLVLGWLAPALACLAPLFVAQQQDPPERRAPREPRGSRQDDEGVETLEEAERVRRPRLLIEAHARESLHRSDTRLRHEPALVARGDGSSLLVFVEWDGGDGDRIAALSPEAPDRDVPVLRELSAVVRPVGVAGADGRIHVLWTELDRGVGQIHCAIETEPGRFDRPVALTTGARANMNVEAAVHSDGRVWVAWEAELPPPPGATKAGRDVLVAPLERDEAGRPRLGEPLVASTSRFSDIDPAIASAGARLWVGFAAYRGRDYEIEVRPLDPATGAFGEAVCVSASPAADDLHPALCGTPGGDVWVAWDSIVVPLRGSSVPDKLANSSNRRRLDSAVRCALVRDGAVLLPQPRNEGVEPGIVEGAPMLSQAGGLPRLALDRKGRLWIAYRELDREGGRNRVGFPVLVQSLLPHGWSNPDRIESSACWPEEPSIAAHGDGVRVAFACDERMAGGRRRDLETMVPERLQARMDERGVDVPAWIGVQGIGVATFEPPQRGLELPPMHPLAPAAGEPHFHPAGERLDDPIVSGEAHFEVARGEQRWKVYFGDLHRHSTLSRCSRGMEPMPGDRWASGRDVHLLDFMALTDHSNGLDPLAWWHLDKQFRLRQSEGFCTLAGYEWSSLVVGHHNVILADRLAPMNALDNDLGSLYAVLERARCVSIPHHPSDGRFPVDFPPCDDSRTRLIEIYQAQRGSYEFDGCFKQSPSAVALDCFAHDALALGRRFGIIASTDHGDGQAYACALAERLDRASLFEALHARRTYGATAKGMLIDLRVDGAVMGEEARCSAPPTVRVRALGACDLAELVVYRNGRIVEQVGRGAEPANTLAPIRLVMRPKFGSEALQDEWRLPVAIEGARFGLLIDPEVKGLRRHELPSWRLEEAGAVFRVPAGFDGRGAREEYPLHVFAGAAADAVSAAARSGEMPGGGSFVLSVELGDSVVALAPGLGTRELTREWVDEDLPAGASWYAARMIHVDGEIAWSSPIFVTREP